MLPAVAAAAAGITPRCELRKIKGAASLCVLAQHRIVRLLGTSTMHSHTAGGSEALAQTGACHGEAMCIHIMTEAVTRSDIVLLEKMTTHLHVLTKG